MSDGALLIARDLRKTYHVRERGSFKRRPWEAVRGVSLKVKTGSVLGIVGESGCGKSTLARMLLGLETPTSGQIWLNGEEISSLSRIDVARRIQPIFQDPYLSLNPRKRIRSIIGLPLKIQGFSNAEIEARVREMMDLTGLPQRLANAYPSQLSGGQRQRVAIARALIAKPQVVICDEPTSALDVSIQAQILNLLGSLQRELGLTYVLISHNLAVVEHISDEILVMRRGVVVEEGPVEKIFAQPQSGYTRLLLDSVLTPNPELGLPDLADCVSDIS